MGNYCKFAALLALSCFTYTCSVTAFAAGPLPAELSPEDEVPVEAPVEVPPEEQLPPMEDTSEGGRGEVVVEDGKNVYHIEADTIIIQPVDGVETPPGDGSEVPDTSDGEDALSPDEVDASANGLEVPAVLEEEEVVYPVISAYALDAGDFPFYGSGWVTGSASGLGDVLLFFPVNYKEGYIGTDNLGRLFNVSNNTWTGVLYDAGGTSYTVNFGAFGLPYYRRYNGSNYTNVTLYLVPEDGNILFPDSPSPLYSLGDLLPYISVLLLGGVFVCCMRRS